MSDVVERLQGSRTPQGGLWPYPNLHDEAADEITRLREELAAYRARKPVVYSPDAQAMSDRVKAAEAERDALREENARLREALKPFAIPADTFKHFVPDSSIVEEEFTLGQLRKARDAIREEGKDA